MTSEDAWAENARYNRFCNSHENGATSASHGARTNAEQRNAIAMRSLMKRGEIWPLKAKYNPYR